MGTLFTPDVTEITGEIPEQYRNMSVLFARSHDVFRTVTPHSLLGTESAEGPHSIFLEETLGSCVAYMGNAPYDTKDVNDIDRALRGLVKSADIEGFFGTQHTGVYPLIACEPFEEGVRARGSTGDVNPFALFDALPFDRLAPEFSEFAAYAQHRSGDGMVAHTLGEAVARIIEVHMHAPTLHEFYVPKTP